MSKQSIRYYPSQENRDFLLDFQAEKRKEGPMIGLDRAIDLLLTELRERRDADLETVKPLNIG